MSADRKKKAFKFKDFFSNLKKSFKQLFHKKVNKSSKDSKKTDGENAESPSKLKVINGTRKRNRIIRIIIYVIIVAIIITLIVLNSLSPTGLIEAVQNAYATWGEGEFPISVYSANGTYFNCSNGVIGIVNDSFFELYDDDGKLLQAVSHGMSDPVLKTSEARFVLYDRNRYSLSVFNYSEELHSVDSETPIISAAIGRNGTYAIVTDSDTSKNTVTVYNKDNEELFKWNSANYYITDVVVFNEGDKIALSMLDSVGGSFKSFVYILQFDKVEPAYVYSFDDIVSSITSCGENYVLANGFDRAYIVPWGGNAETDIKVSGVIRCFDYELSGNSCIAFGREDNEQANFVTVIDKGGHISASFEVNDIVRDICVSENLVGVLTDSQALVYDLKGNLKNSYPLEVEGKYIGISEDGFVLVLDNSKLAKVG